MQLFDLNDPPEITIDKDGRALRMEMGVNEQAREEQSSFTYSIRLRSTKVKESRGKGSLGAHTTPQHYTTLHYTLGGRCRGGGEGAGIPAALECRPSQLSADIQLTSFISATTLSSRSPLYTL